MNTNSPLRPLINRSAPSISYIRNLCKQIKNVSGLKHETGGEKPEVNVCVGAKGSGKSFFSCFFYHPLIFQSSSTFSWDVELDKLERDFPVAIRLLFYMICCRFIYLHDVPEPLSSQATVTTDSFRREIAKIDCLFPSIESIPSTHELITHLDSSRTVEQGFVQMFCFNNPLASPDEDSPTSKVKELLPANHEEALDLFRSLSPTHSPAFVPLLVLVDEIGTGDKTETDSDPVFRSMVRMTRDGEVLFMGAGAYHQYIQAGMEKSRLKMIPYRLNCMFSYKHIISFIETHPKPDEVVLNPREVFKAMLRAGGNLRRMKEIMDSFISGQEPSFTDMVKEEITKPVIQDIMLSGLPLEFTDELPLGDGFKKCVKFFEAKFNTMLAPFFSSLIPSHRPASTTGFVSKLTSVVQLVGPLNTIGRVESRSREPLARLVETLLRDLEPSGKLSKLDPVKVGLVLERVLANVILRRWQLAHSLFGGVTLDRLMGPLVDRWQQGVPAESTDLTGWKSTVLGAVNQWPEESELDEAYASILLSSSSSNASKNGHDEDMESPIPSPEVVDLFPLDLSPPETITQLGCRMSKKGRMVKLPKANMKPWAPLWLKGHKYCTEDPLPKGVCVNTPGAAGMDLFVNTGTMILGIDVKLTGSLGHRDKASAELAKQFILAVCSHPQPTVIVSMRGRRTDKQMVELTRYYHENQPTLVRHALDTLSSKHPEMPGCDDDLLREYLKIPHLIVGKECLGMVVSGIFEKYLDKDLD